MWGDLVHLAVDLCWRRCCGMEEEIRHCWLLHHGPASSCSMEGSSKPSGSCWLLLVSPISGCLKHIVVPGLLLILFIAGEQSKTGTLLTLSLLGLLVLRTGRLCHSRLLWGCQLSEGVLMCSQDASSATLWLACDSGDAANSQSQGQSLQRWLCAVIEELSLFLSSEVRSERWTSFNCCMDEKAHQN